MGGRGRGGEGGKDDSAHLAYNIESENGGGEMLVSKVLAESCIHTYMPFSPNLPREGYQTRYWLAADEE